MSRPTLTPAGERFAVDSQYDSIVARIALLGYDNTTWPEHYVRTAIEACNAKGAPA